MTPGSIYDTAVGAVRRTVTRDLEDGAWADGGAMWAGQAAAIRAAAALADSR